MSQIQSHVAVLLVHEVEKDIVAVMSEEHQEKASTRDHLVNAVFASTAEMDRERPFVLVSAKIRPESELKGEALYEGFEIKHSSEHRSLDEAMMHAELLGLKDMKILCDEEGRPSPSSFQQTIAAELEKSILTTKLLKNHKFLAPTMLNMARVVDQIAKKTIGSGVTTEEAFNEIADDMITKASMGWFL